MLSVPFMAGLTFGCQHSFHLASLYLLCFQTNCNVRDQLLSFYMKNVFSHLGVGSDKLYVISAFQVLKLPCAPSTRLTSAVKKLKRTFLKLGEKGIYKAIHELDILLPWIQAYIQTIV
uniref:Interleukin family protein n=1 Tax=Strix occidentalis caurina TaxID=311401 RepID=A0A8D0KUA6_STROC